MNVQNFELEIHELVRQAVKNHDISLIEAKCNDGSGSDFKTILDQVYRNILLESLNDIDADISYVENCIEFSIMVCRKSLLSPSMPAILLSDVFDVLILDKVEQMFNFVEENVHVWKEEMFFTACKNILLRLCNNLLRRLSRSRNTIFCGRILLFLAKFFPFSERSGLNIISEFNLDNITEFANEPIEVDSYRLIDDDELDEKQLNSDLKIDYNLYRKFWMLQDYFRDPVKCYTEWTTFSNNASDILLAFESYKLDLKFQQFDHSNGTHYFAKYLTNQKLLELQLSDANFRRYVLLQYLIIFQFLRSNVKLKNDKNNLKQDQIDLVNQMSEQIYKLLESTSLNGKQFVDNIKFILKREEHWVTWKKNGCKEFEKQSNITNMDIDEDECKLLRSKIAKGKAKKPIGDLIRAAAQKKQFYMRDPDATKLWNLAPNNLNSCKTKHREFFPSMDDFLKTEDSKRADPETLIEEQYKLVNSNQIKNNGWRTLRLMARKNPFFFSSSNATNNNSINNTNSTK